MSLGGFPLQAGPLSRPVMLLQGDTSWQEALALLFVCLTAELSVRQDAHQGGNLTKVILMPRRNCPLLQSLIASCCSESTFFPSSHHLGTGAAWLSGALRPSPDSQLSREKNKARHQHGNQAWLVALRQEYDETCHYLNDVVYSVKLLWIVHTFYAKQCCNKQRSFQVTLHVYYSYE